MADMRSIINVINNLDEIVETTVMRGSGNADEIDNLKVCINTLKAWAGMSDKTSDKPSINYKPLLSVVNYEYDHLFSSDDNEPCPIDGWMPIATERIKHPERILEYIERGILRKHIPNNA